MVNRSGTLVHFGERDEEEARPNWVVNGGRSAGTFGTASPGRFRSESAA